MVGDITRIETMSSLVVKIDNNTGSERTLTRQEQDRDDTT